MTVVTLSAKGHADAAAVWERYAEPAHWSEWAPQISRVECDAERIAAGVTGRVVGLGGISVGFVINTVDEVTRRWSWTVRRFHVSIRLDHAVRPHPDGSATSLIMDGALPLLLGYAPVAQLALRRLVAR